MGGIPCRSVAEAGNAAQKTPLGVASETIRLANISRGLNERGWYAGRPRIRPAVRRDSVPKRPTWLPPTLPGGANLEAPSEWLKYSRACRRGNDTFHPACCQMKQMHMACPQRMFLGMVRHCHHPHPSGAPPFPAPQGARTWSHSDGDSRLAPWRESIIFRNFFEKSFRAPLRVRIRVGGGDKASALGRFHLPRPLRPGGELLAHPPWIPLCGTVTPLGRLAQPPQTPLAATCRCIHCGTSRAPWR